MLMTVRAVSPVQQVEGSGRRSLLSRITRPTLISGGIAALLAILAGGALAVAPVSVTSTTVAWPEAGSAPSSTVLLLTNQTPYTLDLDFDAAAVSAAVGTADGTVFATMQPTREDAAQLGLVVSAEGNGVTVASGGKTETVPVSAGDSFSLHSDVDGLTLARGDETVFDWPGVLPPQVDALITTADGVGAADLSARLLVVDDFNTSPTLIKYTLMVILVAALAYALFALRRDDRNNRGPLAEARPAPERRPWWRRFVLADLVIVLGLAGWVFLGPMTDDDGYYANMALNYGDASYVGNYYQMFNQSFTPFTWFWQLLYFWQELGGRSPVWLRVPALLAAIIAWFLTRSFLDRALGERRGWYRRIAHGFLALVYLAWWLPYAIGTRPEILGALGSAIALVLLARAVDRRTLLPAAFAALAAGLAFAAHPTGGVAFAPVIVAIPALWRIARRTGDVRAALLRTLGVISVGSVALLAAFADGSLHDFLTGSARFAAVETPLGWTDEAARYTFLLSDSPMGSYAKRAVVLVALVALLWFLVLWITARVQRPGAMTSRVSSAGWAFAFALLALWVTTSKWTHHFGALSVLGPLLLTVVLVLGPAQVRAVLGDRPVPGWLPIAVVGSFLPPVIVAMKGPNEWAYAWDQFMYGEGESPRLGPLGLDSAAVWVPLAILALVGAFLLLRRRGIRWGTPVGLFAATAFVGVFFLVSTGFLYGTFANATARGLSSFSVGAANLKDPLGDECLVEDAIDLWDATTGTDLAATTGEGSAGAVRYREPRIPEAPAAELLDEDALTPGGWPASDPPPAGSPTIWADSEAGLAGAHETGWYELPAQLADQQRVTVLVGGSASGDATGVVAQVGVEGAGGVTVTRESWITDAADRPGWRTLIVDVNRADLKEGAVLRLIGVDGSTAPDDWFGFSAPRLVDRASMRDYVDHGSPTLVAWQSSFWFPCERPTTIADGIIEPPVYATTWADVSPDNIWVQYRGGALAGAARIATVSTPATGMVEEGSTWGRLERLEYLYPTGGYTLEQSTRTVLGLSSPFGEASQLVEADRAKK